MLLWLSVAGCAFAAAQPPPDEDRPPPPRPFFGGHPDGPPEGGPPGPPFGRPPRGPFRDGPPGYFRRLDHPMSLFRPLPTDMGPPAPGEIEKLIKLAEEKIPRFGNRLRDFQKTRPLLFERRFMREFAPILRQLQRLYGQDATLADTYRDHWQLNYDLRQIRNRVAAGPQGQVDGRLEDEARKMFATMVRLETRVAERELEKREQNAEGVIDGRIEDVLSPDYDANGEPPPLREAIRAVRRAKTDEERDTARSELRARVRRAIEMEIRDLRELRDRLKARGDEEVDRRVERMKHAPRPPRGPMPDSNPTADSNPVGDSEPAPGDEP